MASYRTIAAAAKVELKIEKSRFLGYAAPTAELEAAQSLVAALRQEHRQATHVCYAYRIGDGPSALTYFTDHGEPSGTAGKPILGAILRQDLTDVTVVVVRYFGGKKLGVRGLIEAYGAAASQALEAAGFTVRRRLRRATVRCAYAQLTAVTRLVRQVGGEVAPPVYDARQVTMEVTVPEEEMSGLRAGLDALAAKLTEGAETS